MGRAIEKGAAPPQGAAPFGRRSGKTEAILRKRIEEGASPAQGNPARPAPGDVGAGRAGLAFEVTRSRGRGPAGTGNSDGRAGGASEQRPKKGDGAVRVGGQKRMKEEEGASADDDVPVLRGKAFPFLHPRGGPARPAPPPFRARRGAGSQSAALRTKGLRKEGKGKPAPCRSERYLYNGTLVFARSQVQALAAPLCC
jgi:hypothetical protein